MNRTSRKQGNHYSPLMGHFQHSLIDPTHRDLLSSNYVPGTVLTENKWDKVFFHCICRQPINICQIVVSTMKKNKHSKEARVGGEAVGYYFAFFFFF